jgi:hypothetical protein
MADVPSGGLAAEAARRPAAPTAAADAPLTDEYWDSVLKYPRAQADGDQMKQRQLAEIQRHVLRASPAAAANVPSRFRQPTRSGSSGGTRSGSMSRSGCSAIHANSAPVGSKRMGVWPEFDVTDLLPICLALGCPDGETPPTPLSGGDRKALTKEPGKARAMTGILAAQSTEMRAKGTASSRQIDCFPKAGTSGGGAMAGPSIHPQPSIRPSTAAFPGWKSSVPDARLQTMSICSP